MNDRNRRIDDFLKYFRDIALQNPSYRLTNENVYYELTNLGVPENEKGIQINQYFPGWVNEFRYNSNCNVFVNPNWSYFCQFISKDELARCNNEHLKIYIPLDFAHIERGAKEIFEFLSNEEISHLSKIGSHVRFDNIVVRLINKEDVIKLVNFINNNKYIQEGLITANPFAFSIDGISMAVDGSLSFNSTVASLVKIYINNKIDNNSLNTVGVDNFYEFVQGYYNYVFSSVQGLERLSCDFSEYSFLDSNKLVNYKNVFELLLNVRKDDFTFESYIGHYTKCADSFIQNAKIEELDSIKMGYISDNGNNIRDNRDKDVVQRTNEMLLQVIDGMIEKYNDQYLVLSTINKYILYGKEDCITRYKNLRNIVINATFREDLRNILSDYNINFMNYAQYLLKQRKDGIINEEIDEKESYSITEKSVILTIQEILDIMTKKNGRYEAYTNLVRFINTGESTMLTRDFNLRERVVNSTFRIDLKNILTKRNIKLEDYLKVILETFVISGEVYLEQVILETYYKYEKKYQEGLSSVNGKVFVMKSLSKLIEKGNYNGFTRDNNARMNLENNVSVSEVVNIIKRTLNIEKMEELSYFALSELVEQYVDLILENNRDKNFSK